VQDSNGAARDRRERPGRPGYISLGRSTGACAVAVDGARRPTDHRRQALYAGPPLFLSRGAAETRAPSTRARARRPATARPRRPDPGARREREAPRREAIELPDADRRLLVAILFIITFFIFKEGLLFIIEVGPGRMLALDWAPTKGNSAAADDRRLLLATRGALLLGVPLGLSCAIFLVSSPAARAQDPRAIELLAGIPSVVYGFLAWSSSCR
jgi:hypothetical protein